MSGDAKAKSRRLTLKWLQGGEERGGSWCHVCSLNSRATLCWREGLEKMQTRHVATYGVTSPRILLSGPIRCVEFEEKGRVNS